MTPERLDGLINAHVDGLLDEEGESELARALDADPEARRAFVRAMDQQQALADLKRKTVRRASTRPGGRFALVAASVAAAAVVATVLLLPREPAPSPTTGVAREAKPPPPPFIPPEPRPAPRPEPPVPAPPAVVPAPPPERPREEPKEPAPPPAPPAAEQAPSVTSPPPPRGVTVAAVAKLLKVEGRVFLLNAADRARAAEGHALAAGQGIETDSESLAVVLFSDGTRVELRAETIVREVSDRPAKRVVLAEGALVADVARQAQPMVFATPQAEATVLGTRLALAAATETRLEVKEGKVRLQRLEDRRTVDVGAGQYAVAKKGGELAARRSTRGFMMAGPVLWAEDFEDARAMEKDWTPPGRGVRPTTGDAFEVELRAEGVEGGMYTRPAFDEPFRVSVDVEFTQRLKGTLLAVRLHAWKGGDPVHVDLDESRYYLTAGGQTVTVDAGRKGPRRERWAIDVRPDGGVSFLVDGKEMLKARRANALQAYHVLLMARGQAGAPAGARVRFDNLLVERVQK